MPDTMRASEIIDRAKSLGASVAGVARVEDVKASPSHQLYPRIGSSLEVPWQAMQGKPEWDDVVWPKDAVSAVVIGIAHSAEEPELDWWDGRGTPGNRRLIRINRYLSEWIEKTRGCMPHKLPYLVEKGGVFLKDAAVMAGLGCVGWNNMLITPEYGPRIRFRALLLDRELEATGPIEFVPCEDCERPCRAACPVGAFEPPVYSVEELGQSGLPGVDGTYDRASCNRKMEQDLEDAVSALGISGEEREGIRRAVEAFEEGPKGPSEGRLASSCCVKFCRECELSCPVGKRTSE
jgi:epoxyqueuosine reductase